MDSVFYYTYSSMSVSVSVSLSMLGVPNIDDEYTVFVTTFARQVSSQLPTPCEDGAALTFFLLPESQ